MPPTTLNSEEPAKRGGGAAWLRPRPSVKSAGSLVAAEVCVSSWRASSNPRKGSLLPVRSPQILLVCMV